MKKGLGVLMLLWSLAACNDSTTLTVKNNAVGRELDTLGEKIEEKAEAAGDSIKAAHDDIKENVKARMDSVKANRNNAKE